MIGDAKGGEMAGVSYRTMNKLFQVLELRRRQQVKENIHYHFLIFRPLVILSNIFFLNLISTLSLFIVDENLKVVERTKIKN